MQRKGKVYLLDLIIKPIQSLMLVIYPVKLRLSIRIIMMLKQNASILSELAFCPAGPARALPKEFFNLMRQATLASSLNFPAFPTLRQGRSLERSRSWPLPRLTFSSKETTNSTGRFPPQYTRVVNMRDFRQGYECHIRASWPYPSDSARSPA